MKKLRVLLVVDKDLVPPEDYKGKDYTEEEWRTEYDVQVTLRELGHEVKTLGVVRNLEVIDEVFREWKPDIAFNLLQDVYTVIPYDYNMVAYFELLGLAYTGCNPMGLLISRDKAMTKKLLRYHRIHVPRFTVCRRDRKVKRSRRLEFPLIVKSLTEDASLGISGQSIVYDDESLAERVDFVHDRLESHAIVEQFIAGREFYVGVMGNTRLEVFPPWELIVEHKAQDAELLATRKVKWDRAYQKKHGVTTRAAKDLPEPLASRLGQISRRIYRVLNLSGYARLDFRLAEDGTAYLLEANANPDVAYGEDFAESAEHAGLPYGKVVQRILNLGLRWKEEHAII
ncbi:MAG: D-alanine--D-alanine ligase [Planctomycetota bacterium]